MRKLAQSTSRLFLDSLLSAIACGGVGQTVSVEIVEPADGALVTGPEVRVLLAARGVEIAPASDEREGTAHHHLFVDRGQTPPGDTIPSGVTGILHLGRGQTEFLFQGFGAGEHTVIVVLGDRAHVPLDPPVSDTVSFTVGP